MMNTTRDIPTLRPDHFGASRAAAVSYHRAAAALVLGKLKGASPDEIVRRSWADDKRAALLTRAPSAPTAIGSTAPLARLNVMDLLTGLVPDSAALQLFEHCPVLDFSQATQFSIPVVSTRPSIPFVGEGAPIPAGQPATGGVTIGPPSKLGFIVSLSRELENATPTSASVILGRMLAESVARSLDAVVFDAQPAVAGLRPAGLLFNVVANTAAPAGASILDTLVADFASIAKNFAASSLNAANMVTVLNPEQGTKFRLTRGYDPASVPVLMSPAIAPSTLIGVIPQAIFVGFDREPDIEISSMPALVFDDVPTELVTSAGAVGAPTISMFQNDMVAIKLRLFATWAAVAPGAVQNIVGANW
jgi:hypothetical protein